MQISDQHASWLSRPSSFKYDFDADSTTVDVLSEEEFWSSHIHKWHLKEDSNSDVDFEDDRLTSHHLVFEIVVFLELELVVIHFRYKKAGWRPRKFSLIVAFRAMIRIQDYQLSLYQEATRGRRRE